MRCIIAGSRSLAIKWDKIKLVSCAVHRSGWLYDITEIVSGGCRGIDLAGEQFASDYAIPVKRFLPDWEHEGKAAGPRRNQLMADYADALILVWDGVSRGSADMKKKAEQKGLKFYELIVNEETKLE